MPRRIPQHVPDLKPVAVSGLFKMVGGFISRYNREPPMPDFILYGPVKRVGRQNAKRDQECPVDPEFRNLAVAIHNVVPGMREFDQQVEHLQGVGVATEPFQLAFTVIWQFGPPSS